MSDERSNLTVGDGAEQSRPIAFAGLQGWLHAPRGYARDTGVVIVSPIGRDARCAYMPMRLFAQSIATAGFPVLRYDHPGAGDSLDLPGNAEAFAAWRDGVRVAIAELRRLTGVRRVVLTGVRLGGSLAALVADEADGLMLLAPVLNGRSWLRRLRFSTAVLADRPDADEFVFDAGELCLSADTAAQVSNIDLAAGPTPRVPVFVAAQNSLVNSYAASLTAAGAEVCVESFPGFKDLFAESHSNLPPLKVFERACAWLDATFGEGQLAPIQLAAVGSEPVLHPPGARERVIEVGDGLWGVLCEPARPARHAPTLLFCGTGGDPRGGVGGFATQTARRLAQMGVPSLRFDYSGLGDSPMAGDDPRCHVFETPREGETDVAVAFLKARGFGDIVVFGVCAGAYHALRAGWRNPDVAGVFAVSPVKLVWRSGDTLTFGRYKNGRPTGAYLKALADPAAWKQALADKVDLSAVMLTLLGRLRSRLAGWATRRGPDAPLRQMELFSRRGGRACFIMGVNDASLEELSTYFGAEGSRLRRMQHTTVEVIPQLDHGLACNLSRRIAANVLQTWLTAPRNETSTPVISAESSRGMSTTKPGVFADLTG